MKEYLKELFYGRLLSTGFGSNGNASTPVEIIDIIPYFSKKAV
jgi:hypothetical protein